MKKVSLIAIATGVAFIFIALIWSGFSWHRIQNDLQHISQKNYTEKQEIFSANTIKRVNVNIDNVQVIIKTQTDNSHVRVAYFTSEDDKFTITNSGDTVSVSRAKAADPHFLCFFRCIGTPGTITVYVPADSIYAYSLTADNAPVSFDNAATLRTQTIHVESSNSSAKLQHIAADGTIDLHSDNGSVQLRYVTATGKLSLTSSNASNELVNVQAPSIDSQADNGSTSLDTVTATDLTAHTSNASITLTRLAAKHSTLTSDNGSVHGSLVGSKDDFAIKIGSSNGSIQLDGTKYDGAYFSGGNNAAQSLSVQSSNSSIKLTFVK
jgi:DUF4097 and DUF4098 domain-containing protein YvlB